MTGNPKSWDFKTWFVILFCVVIFAILGIVWWVRSFDDAVQVAAVGLPLVTAAVLAWGLSEISRREERKSQDRRLQDDRDHERDLRRSEIESKRIDDYRGHQRSNLQHLQRDANDVGLALRQAAAIALSLPMSPDEDQSALLGDLNSHLHQFTILVGEMQGLIAHVDDERVYQAAGEYMIALSQAQKCSFHPARIRARTSDRGFDKLETQAKELDRLMDQVGEKQVSLNSDAIAPYMRALFAVNPVLSMAECDADDVTPPRTPVVASAAGH